MFLIQWGLSTIYLLAVNQFVKTFKLAGLEASLSNYRIHTISFTLKFQMGQGRALEPAL